jgi:hypothetical protein
MIRAAVCCPARRRHSRNAAATDNSATIVAASSSKTPPSNVASWSTGRLGRSEVTRLPPARDVGGCRGDDADAAIGCAASCARAAAGAVVSPPARLGAAVGRAPAARADPLSARANPPWATALSRPATVCSVAGAVTAFRPAASETPPLVPGSVPGLVVSLLASTRAVRAPLGAGVPATCGADEDVAGVDCSLAGEVAATGLAPAGASRPAADAEPALAVLWPAASMDGFATALPAPAAAGAAAAVAVCVGRAARGGEAAPPSTVVVGSGRTGRNPSGST